MLQLKKIVKTYTAGDTKVTALRGIDLSFRENELVAILGPSGCGKTTLLNIIGGLDNYDSGDLIINGVSTKDYRDSDWDTYRNHSIGFVFQSYNLIPHQTVLANVELALTLSGVSKAERRRRAIDALKAVGLEDQIKKKPNQMSGGQMQRVAIARALVNDPDILLADEPTGALDSETSVQLMNILKEISKKKLIIMVTHNPELAEQYATRIVRVLDGQILSDSDPVPNADTPLRKPERVKKPSMSFFTALSLSLNNLMTKKGRTFLTSFAGSIGIIGIALILALSNGVQTYINRVQEDTLSSYPISIQAESMDMGSLISSFMGVKEESETQKTDDELGSNVYSSAIMYELMNALNSTEITTNNLEAFKKYLETPDANGNLPLDGLATSIKYSYNLDLNIFTKDKDGKIVKSDITELMKKMMASMYGEDAVSMMAANPMMASSGSFNIWEEMISSTEKDDEYLISPLLRDQYDVIYGDWPREYNEVVLVVDKNNSVSDLVLYSLGLITADELAETIKQSSQGQQVDTTIKSWSFEDICGITLKYIPTIDTYGYNAATGTYTDISTTDTGLSYLYNGAEELKIVGIIRGSENAVSTMMSGSIGYTSELTKHIINHIESSDIIQNQLKNPETDVISGLPFPNDDNPEPTEAEMAAAVKQTIANKENSVKAEVYVTIMSQPSDAYIESMIGPAMANMTREAVEQALLGAYTEQMPTADVESVKQYIASMSDEELFGYVREMMTQQMVEQYAAAIRAQFSAMTADQLAAMYDAASFTDAQYAALYDEYVPSTVSDSTYDKNLKRLGYVDINSPDTVNIYAATFANKEKIADVISAYNDTVEEDDEITYVDYVAILMSSITTIINAISYILMAFVSISLIVSSIMIGIITYISVLERIKEIGILRAIGASKKDIKRVFNAETIIVGFAAGAIGIIATVLICIPANIIIRALTGIPTLGAVLPPVAAVILVAISVILTLLAGLFPAAIAAKKDPVIALRSE